MCGFCHSVRPLASVAFLALLAFTTAGCNITQSKNTTGTLGIPAGSRSDANWRRSAETWGNRFRANPGDPEAAINYAQALRGMGQRAQAAAVLERASIQNPKHKGVRGAYGRALADIGNYQQALDVLNRAHMPDQLDWHILSVQGAMLDQMGRHDEAQRYYATALRIAPDEPSVLSNLGLSYALSKDLVRAEFDAAARYRTRARRYGCPAEPCGRGRTAGAVRRSEDHRARWPAVGGGRRQRDASAADAGAAERVGTTGRVRQQDPRQLNRRGWPNRPADPSSIGSGG